MAADADVPESVRDARWGANFEPNPHVPYQTTNTLFAGPRLIRQEIWIRENRLGHGGFGVVWLEKAHPDNRSPIRIRAVKELRVGHNDTRRQECIRELLALVKFSQQKVIPASSPSLSRDTNVLVCGFLRRILQLVRESRCSLHRYGVLPTWRFEAVRQRPWSSR